MKRFMQFLTVVAVGSLAGNAVRADMIVNLQASNYTQATGTWANNGTGGNFGVTGGVVANAPVKETVAGATAVTFSGLNGCTLETAPASSSVTGGNAWSAEAWVYNPSIGAEEDYFQWGRRASGVGRAADLVYGTDPNSGAYVHWGNDAGFSKGVPVAGAWHYIAVTYSGVANGGVESLYVDGVLDRTDVRTLDIDGSINMIVGAGFQNWMFVNPASLSIGALRLRTEVLSVDEIHDIFVDEGRTYGVPEPSSIVLLSAALFGLLAYAWRRRK